MPTVRRDLKHVLQTVCFIVFSAFDVFANHVHLNDIIFYPLVVTW